MQRVLTTAFAFIALLAAPPALAQPIGQGRYAAVLSACKTEAAVLCPSKSDQSSGRNQAICLRPYRTSLSLACRRAVKAASP